MRLATDFLQRKANKKNLVCMKKQTKETYTKEIFIAKMHFKQTNRKINWNILLLAVGIDHVAPLDHLILNNKSVTCFLETEIVDTCILDCNY